MINLLAQSLVILAILVLIGALLPVSKLIVQLPSGVIRRCWYELTVLIVLLVAGYISYLLTYWDRHSAWPDFIVPGIFFFCAIFVWLTAQLSLQTAYDIRRVTLLEQESIKDPLTGLYNRRYLDRRMEEEVKRARRYDLQLSVLLIDIDHFKQVNDTHGHQVGDSLLIHLSDLIVNQIRGSDVAARYGGDELVVLAPSTTVSSAALLAERLRQHVETDQLDLLSENGKEEDIRVTVSIGIAGLNPEIIDSESLFKHADEALYHAKERGRNQIITHTVNAPKVSDS